MLAIPKMNRVSLAVLASTAGWMETISRGLSLLENERSRRDGQVNGRQDRRRKRKAFPNPEGADPYFQDREGRGVFLFHLGMTHLPGAL